MQESKDYKRLLFGVVNITDEFTKPTIMVIIFRDILLFEQIFLSPQVKRSVVISNKHDMYELPHELLNNIRLRILGN